MKHDDQCEYRRDQQTRADDIANGIEPRPPKDPDCRCATRAYNKDPYPGTQLAPAQTMTPIDLLAGATSTTAHALSVMRDAAAAAAASVPHSPYPTGATWGDTQHYLNRQSWVETQAATHDIARLESDGGPTI